MNGGDEEYLSNLQHNFTRKAPFSSISSNHFSHIYVNHSRFIRDGIGPSDCEPTVLQVLKDLGWIVYTFRRAQHGNDTQRRSNQRGSKALHFDYQRLVGVLQVLSCCRFTARCRFDSPLTLPENSTFMHLVHQSRPARALSLNGVAQVEANPTRLF